MSDINGMHVADGQQYHIEQMCRAASGSVTILDFLMKNSDLRPFGHNGIMYADKENCNWYGVLRYGRASQGIPPSDRIIHVRQYHPDWRLIALNMPGTDPDNWTVNEGGVRAWAQHCVNLLSDWRGTEEHHQLKADLFSDPRVAISPFNEQDIEPLWVDYMQTRHWYDLIGRTALVWLDEINRLRPDRVCLTMTPPLAGGHEPWGDQPDSEYTLPAMRDMLKAYDIIGGHCYGLLNQSPKRGMFGEDAKWYGLRLWRGMTDLAYPDTGLELKSANDPGGLVYQARQLGKRVHISEAGTFKHDDAGFVDENWRHMSRYLDIASKCDLVTGVDWFIWNSNSQHSGNRIWYSEGLREKLENAPRYPAAEWPTVGEERPILPLPEPDPGPILPPRTHPANPLDLSVGPGVLALMLHYGDTADTDEMYQDWTNSVLSRTMAASGAIYRAWTNNVEGKWKVTREVPGGSGGGGEPVVVEVDNVRGLLQSGLEPRGSTTRPRKRKSRS